MVYLRARLERDHKEIYQRLKAGEFASVRQASRRITFSAVSLAARKKNHSGYALWSPAHLTDARRIGRVCDGRTVNSW
jgi:transposase-like protein